MTTVAFAHTVVIGIGYAIPPYVLMDRDAGLEVDVIREAFSRAGYNARFRYLPNLRLPVVFASGEVDCVVTNSAYDLSRDTGIHPYYSNETLVFQNYAITLAEKGLHISCIKDLVDKRVLAFSNARGYLIREFAVMAAGNPQYQEQADQGLQVRMLYSDRVDVVISDERVFQYWRQHLDMSPMAGGFKL